MLSIGFPIFVFIDCRRRVKASVDVSVQCDTIHEVSTSPPEKTCVALKMAAMTAPLPAHERARLCKIVSLFEAAFRSNWKRSIVVKK